MTKSEIAAKAYLTIHDEVSKAEMNYGDTLNIISDVIELIRTMHFKEQAMCGIKAVKGE